MLISFEGLPGIGKTTLVRKCSIIQKVRVIEEEYSSNPYLNDFKNRHLSSQLSIQLFFLTLKLEQQFQIESFLKSGLDVFTDYFLDIKERVFTNLFLNDVDFNTYWRHRRVIKNTSPRPDILVYLKSDLETVLTRIKSRNRHFERDVKLDLLHSLDNLYEQEFMVYEGKKIKTTISEWDQLTGNEIFAKAQALINTI